MLFFHTKLYTIKFLSILFHFYQLIIQKGLLIELILHNSFNSPVLGILWAIIQPIVSIIVMTFIFGGVANMPSEKGVPYAVMVYSALLCWNFFSSAFSSTSNSLVSNSNLLKKVYFPRLALPISSVVTAFVDFAISFCVLIVIMIGYRYMPSIRILALPLFIILTFLLALGFGLFLRL